MESLRMALSFVKKQVDEKRASLKDLEKKVSRERFNVRANKNQVLSYQDQIGGPDKNISDLMSNLH